MTRTDPPPAGPTDTTGLPPTPPPPRFGTPPGGPGPQPRPQRWLRRSRTDRMVSGVAGGLGEYFGVDPVIFRVLFAVLSFFGGVGLLMYGLAWLLVPEPDIGSSALDRAIGQLRVRRVPPWLVLIGGAIVLWLGWFSWWSPGPTFPAIMLLAVLLLVLIHRLDRPDWLPGPPAGDGWAFQAAPAGAEQAAPGSAPAASSVPSVGPAGPVGSAGSAGSVPSVGSAGSAANPTLEWSPPATGDTDSETARMPLIAPLNDTRRSMQAWLAEAGAAHRQRVRRRRPIKVGAAAGLAIAWAVVALTDAVNRVAFPAYLWVGLAVLATSLVISVLTRRLTASLLVPIAVLAAATFALGGTRASLSDGSGQQSWQPATAGQLVDHRLFAGQATLDLGSLGTLDSARTVHLSQAAGEVRVLLPAGLNATVIADVHLGQITDGPDNDTGRHVEGMNVHYESRPPAVVSGQPITIYVKVAAGHVQVERATG